MEDDIIIINNFHINDELNNFYKKLENCCEDELTCIKLISNSYNKIIDWSINYGNQHFAITINCIGYNYDDLTNNFIEGEKFKIKDYLYKKFPTTTWFFIVSEKTKSNMLHFHAIISIRNFMDYNYTLKNNILGCLLNFSFFGDLKDVTEFDVKVQSLNYFKDVKNWVVYMHKDIYDWKYRGVIFFFSIFVLEFFFTWNPCLGDIYCSFIDNKNIFGGWVVSICFLDNDNLEYFKKLNNLDTIGVNSKLPQTYVESLSILDLFNGIKITNNKIDQRVLINLLQYYLILNEYYIYNDNIYVKINNTKISYILVGGLVDVLYNGFQNNVIFYFNNNFEYYFKGFDFSYLLDVYFVKTKSVIESIKDISTQRINPDFSLIEFNDGVYSIKYDRFFSNKENYVFDNKISTIKYYNKSYNWVRQNKPQNWINGIKNALDIRDCVDGILNKDYIRLCLHIINPIHKDIFNKKSTLFVYGQSNTGKTTLIADIFVEYFGFDNIGSIVSTKNFKWQDLVGKLVGIIDEGRYNSSMSSDLLKITGQERVIVEKKYSKEHVVIDSIPLIILTNILFEDKDESIDKALKNRLFMVEFINKISEEGLSNSNEFKKKLKDEEANIIIYCNKLLFKIKNLDGSFLRKRGKKISNKIILNKLNSGGD